MGMHKSSNLFIKWPVHHDQKIDNNSTVCMLGNFGEHLIWHYHKNVLSVSASAI